MAMQCKLGIIGGTGALGSAIARQLLTSGFVSPADLWISNRSGNAPEFAEWPDINLTRDNQTLASASDLVLISVPPALFNALNIDASDRLVVSVMAGIGIDRLAAATNAKRIIRAMSSPAAGIGLAYSPWHANEHATAADRRLVQAMFSACGETDEVDSEEQIDHFTALTGPVPGFVAYFAKCMTGYAEANGIAPSIAERAIAQLFHASGVTLATGGKSAADHVREMLDYAGTTAAGLEVMKNSPIASSIEAGLAAAARKAKQLGEGLE